MRQMCSVGYGCTGDTAVRFCSCAPTEKSWVNSRAGTYCPYRREEKVGKVFLQDIPCSYSVEGTAARPHCNE